MRIAYSGIGGSGKSTQIKLLVEALGREEAHVSVIWMRGLFLWPRLAGLGKKKNVGSNGSSEAPEVFANPRKRSALFLYVRAAFFLADMWRIELFSLRPAERKGVLVCDRYFDDFILELFGFDLAYMPAMRRMRSLLPRPTLYVFLSIAPGEAVARKAEYSLVVTEVHAAAYETFLAKPEIAAVSARESEDAVAQAIFRLYHAALPAENHFSYVHWLLYEALVLKKEDMLYGTLFCIDDNLLLRAAEQNRSVWRTVEIRAGAKDPSPRVLRLLAAGNEKKALYAEAVASLAVLKDVPYSLVKNDYAVELGGDADVIFYDRAGFETALSALSDGAVVTNMNDRKSDVRAEGKLDMDMHFGLAFGNYAYVPDANLDALSKPEGFVAAVVGHAVAELTVVTMGDMAKVMPLLEDSEVSSKARVLAARSGWEDGYDAWVATAEGLARRGFAAPRPIPVSALLASRIGLYRNQGGAQKFFGEIWMLAKAIRARTLGHIPYHESWAKDI